MLKLNLLQLLFYILIIFPPKNTSKNLLSIAISSQLNSQHVLKPDYSKFSKKISQPYKKFPAKFNKVATINEFDTLEITCSSKQILRFETKFFRLNRWTGRDEIYKSPELLETKGRVEVFKNYDTTNYNNKNNNYYNSNKNNSTLIVKKFKWKDAGIYYCQTTYPNSNKTFKSEAVLIGFIPFDVLNISFASTAIATFIIAFIINWFDLGKYYCNFLENRLQKAKDLNTTINLATPLSIRASKASLHYEKYDSKSQNLFLSSLVNSASNVKSAIAEKVENFELNIPLKDALRGHLDNLTKNKSGVNLDSFLEFSIPLPNLFERRRESAIREETEAELEADACADAEVDKIFKFSNSDADNSGNCGMKKGGPEGPEGPSQHINLKKIKHNLGKTMKSLNIRLKTSEFVSPDFLENITLKLKFHQFNRNFFNPQGSDLYPIGQPEAASRLAHNDDPAHALRKQQQQSNRRGSAISSATRPRTLNLSNHLPTHTSHSSNAAHTHGIRSKPGRNNSGESGIFTIDVIDDRTSHTSDEYNNKMGIGGRSLPASSLVVTPIEADFFSSDAGHHRHAPCGSMTHISQFPLGCSQTKSKSMTPTFFLTLDSSIFENLANQSLTQNQSNQTGSLAAGDTRPADSYDEMSTLTPSCSHLSHTCMEQVPFLGNPQQQARRQSLDVDDFDCDKFDNFETAV